MHKVFSNKAMLINSGTVVQTMSVVTLSFKKDKRVTETRYLKHRLIHW